MNSPLKPFLIFFFGAAACWDIYTTFTGMRLILSNDLFAVVATFFINGLLLFTFAKFPDDITKTIIQILLIAAFLCDFYTAYKGNQSIGKDVEGFGRVFISLVVTLITVGGTIISSYYIFEENPEQTVNEKDGSEEKKK